MYIITRDPAIYKFNCKVHGMRCPSSMSMNAVIDIQKDMEGPKRVSIIRKCDLYDRNPTNSSQGLQAKKCHKIQESTIALCSKYSSQNQTLANKIIAHDNQLRTQTKFLAINTVHRM